MSTAGRVLSGSIASWVQIAVGLLTQVALVPVFLSYWNVKTFGVWVAVQAMVNMFIVLDRGYVDYLGFEFLRKGPAGKDQISHLLFSGMVVAAILALVEMVLVLGLSFYLPGLFIKDLHQATATLVIQAGWAFFFQWLGWTVLNIAGLFFRALVPFGYYPRMQWWSVCAVMLSSITIAFSVALGSNIATTAAAVCVCQILLTLVQGVDLKRLLRREALAWSAPDFRYGIKNLRVSFLLSLKYFFENFRQQGIRLILAPMIGITGVAAFSTMRTASNSLLQGLATVTNPVLPELMRFLNERNQQKTDAAIGTTWLLLVAILAPAAILLQAFAENLFSIWTRGNLLYDPYLFGLLSVSVLVFALSQPALAILIGNNLLRFQIILSLVSFIMLMLGLMAMIHFLGLTGAGWAILGVEVFISIFLVKIAGRWLREHQMKWPSRHARIAMVSVIITFTGIMVMNYFSAFKWIISLVTLFILWANTYRYVNAMPPLVWEKTKGLISRFRV